MPLVPSSYQAPSYLFNGHLETMYPYLFRSINDVTFERQRIELPDGDFLDLDWQRNGNQRLLILCHGLEGNSGSQYMKGMARHARQSGWDVLAINFRSCSGEPNRLLRMYHHGEIEDLTHVVNLITENDKYSTINLCGFSLGGNVVLKFLGTYGSRVSPVVKSAVAISVPCDLGSSSVALDRWDNYLYTRRFRYTLRKKFEEKNRRFPGSLDLKNYWSYRSWYVFDNKYTTALTPFGSAEEYYDQGSANNFLAGITVPTLLMNARNDPFLMSLSYPSEKCRDHRYLFLEMPQYGGHVGFWRAGARQTFAEKRAIEFFNLY